jgi:hypothetical protein
MLNWENEQKREMIKLVLKLRFTSRFSVVMDTEEEQNGRGKCRYIT